MLKLTTDLVVLLCVLGTTAVVLLGWGNLTWRVLGVPRPTEVSVITIWLGFCIVVGCLEFIHLFVPIDWRVTVGVAIVGLLGHAGLFKSKATLLKPEALDRSNAIGLVMITLSAVQRYPWRSLAAMIVTVTWCLRAMETPTMYDSGLYHFGSIRWLNEYPIVPGLGNLHWRLALNQSYFGFLALLNFAPYWEKGYAAGGLFLLLLTAFTVTEFGLGQSKRFRLIPNGILFSYLCLLSGQIANPLPDTGVVLFQMGIFIFFYWILIKARDLNNACIHGLERLKIVTLFMCMTLVTIKLSSVGFAIAAAVITIGFNLKFLRDVVSKSTEQNFFLIAGFIVLTHITRGYLLSGAPFFPSPFGGIWSLPWAVEYGVAINESQLIYAWAKQPGIASPSELAPDFAWITAWVVRLPVMLQFLMVLSTLLLFVAFIMRRSLIGVRRAHLALSIPLVTGLIFWFLTAPDPRFLGAIGILYFVWSVLICQHYKVAQLYIFRGNKCLNRLLRLITISIIFILFIKWTVVPSAVPLGWSLIPSAVGGHQSNRSGLSAFVPIQDAQCWSADLPCAVLLHDGLRIRLFELFDSNYGARRMSFQLEK